MKHYLQECKLSSIFTNLIGNDQHLLQQLIFGENINFTSLRFSSISRYEFEIYGVYDDVEDSGVRGMYALYAAD